MNAHHAIRHGVDFFLLILILGLGLGGILFFVGNKPTQIGVVLTMSVFYIFWGIYHHHHDGNLTGRIVLEYTAISALVATLLSIILLRL